MSCPFCDNPDRNPQITIQVSPPLDWPIEFCRFIEQIQTDRLNVEIALRQENRRLRDSLDFWRRKAQDLMLSGHSSGRYEDREPRPCAESGSNEREIPRSAPGCGGTVGVEPAGAGGEPDVPTNFSKLLEDRVDELIRLHSIMSEDLTQKQLASALKQALLAGDFRRLVSVDGSCQAVIYIPFARVQELEGKIKELEQTIHELDEDELSR